MANSKLANHLKVILERNDVDSDIVSYISTIDNAEDLEEFMENIIDRKKKAHMIAYEAIKNILFKSKNKPESSKNMVTLSHSSSKQSQQPQSSRKNDNASSSSGCISNKQQHQFWPQQKQAGKKKGKAKFQDINAYQEKVEKQDRTACDCLGQEHEFMNNCVVCGRIHCKEEGPGPCLFCGNPVLLKSDMAFDSRNRKLKAVMKPKENKLFDDDKDYFKIKTKSSNKEKMVVALDLASRKVIETTQEDLKIKEKLLEESMEHLKKIDELYMKIRNQSLNDSQKRKIESENEDLIDLLIQMRHKKSDEVEDLGEEDNIMPVIDYGTNIFDEEISIKTDAGVCLSMHQPYASLLIAGVKKHEGRTWPTNHRGRLWIAAAAKAPEVDEIETVENFYREYYQDNSLRFPKEYPVSCLLGCVIVKDCLDQEEYRKRFPNGESNSPYVLICSNPMILPIFYPIVGKHKIYPLDKELHACAKLALKHAVYV